MATGLHIAYGHRHDLKMETIQTTSSMPVLTRTTTATTTVVPADGDNDEREQFINQSVSSDEGTPLIGRTLRGSVDTGKYQSNQSEM